MMFQLRKPNVIPINDHVWLLDDNYREVFLFSVPP